MRLAAQLANDCFCNPSITVFLMKGLNSPHILKISVEFGSPWVGDGPFSLPASVIEQYYAARPEAGPHDWNQAVSPTLA